MKILQIVPSANPASGGVIEAVRQISVALVLLGCDVEIVCFDAPERDWLKDAALPRVHALGPARGGYAFHGSFRRWLDEHADDYDFAIINGLWQYPGFCAHAVLKRKNIPYCVFPHGMLDPWFKVQYPLKHLKKQIYWLLAEFHVLRHARAVFFTCEEERRLSGLSFRPCRFNGEVVGLGIKFEGQDLPALKARFLDSFPHLQGKRILLFLGRFHEKKGCDLVVEAFAKLDPGRNGLVLVMAGPDESGLKAGLQRRASELNLADQVLWLDMLTGDDKWAAFSAADLFCLPSHQENFGIAVVEALACGKPVLISDKVNIWREIAASGAGFVNADTVDGTLKSLDEWLRLSVAGREALSADARRCYEQHFNVMMSARKILANFENESGK